jgi:hypothetical protein
LALEAISGNKIPNDAGLSVAFAKRRCVHRRYVRTAATKTVGENTSQAVFLLPEIA